MPSSIKEARERGGKKEIKKTKRKNQREINETERKSQRAKLFCGWHK